MATSGLLKRLATNSREELRPSGVAVQSRPGTQGKGTRIGLLWILGDVLIVLAALMIAVRGWLGARVVWCGFPLPHQHHVP